MKDQLKKYEEKCEETGETPRKLFIVWEDPQNAGSGGTHPGRLNLPAQSGQVFSIYKTDDGEPPKKGIYYGMKIGGSSSLRPVPFWDAHVTPGTFPLIYLFGQHGWHPNMPKINPKNPNVVSTLQQQIQRATQQQPLSPLSSQWPDAPQSPTAAATSTPSQQQHTNPPQPLHQSRTSDASTQFSQRLSTTGAAPPTSTSPTVSHTQSVQQQPALSSLHLHVPAAQQQQN
uniref:Uncharacterized protein n=1 Tax=Panagrolaimus sp. PS1159 TaxID=55785 RepID=A0AC35EUR5_9BILA